MSATATEIGIAEPLERQRAITGDTMTDDHEEYEERTLILGNIMTVVRLQLEKKGILQRLKPIVAARFITDISVELYPMLARQYEAARGVLDVRALRTTVQQHLEVWLRENIKFAGA